MEKKYIIILLAVYIIMASTTVCSNMEYFNSDHVEVFTHDTQMGGFENNIYPIYNKTKIPTLFDT